MIDIRCEEHLQAARKHADSLGPAARASLDRCIDRYAEDPMKIVRIYKDGSFQAKYNFGFSVFTLVKIDNETYREKFWYPGGYIFWPETNEWHVHT